MLNLISFFAWLGWAFYMMFASSGAIEGAHVDFWFIAAMAFCLAVESLKDFVRGQ